MFRLDRDKAEIRGLIVALQDGTVDGFIESLEWWDTYHQIRELPETKGEKPWKARSH